jgi:Flp pilus assembly protein TadD
MLMEGKTDAALSKILQAAELRPLSAEAHMSLAAIYAQIGEIAKANRERALLKQLTEDSAL